MQLLSSTTEKGVLDNTEQILLISADWNGMSQSATIVPREIQTGH